MFVQDATEKISVAVVNLVQWHHEVYPALMWAFQEAGANVTTFVATDNSISEIVKTWYVFASVNA